MNNRLIGIALLGVAPVALAHHNTGAYFDTEAEFTIAGVVDDVQWRNPHVYFTITGESDSGEEATWRIEAGPTAIMRRLDWNRDTLKAGDAVTVVANPSRREGIKSGYLVGITAPDRTYPSLRGEEAFGRLGVEDAAVEETATGLDGVWTTVLNGEYYAALFEDEPAFLTATGLESLQTYDESTEAPALECVPSVAPNMMWIPDTKLVRVAGDTIRIRAEFTNGERIIYLDPDDAPTEPTLHGRSVGRWEGDTLVIESDLFGPHRMGVMFGVASSPGKKLVERIRLDDDGKGLTYSFTMDDPVMLSEPLGGEFRWTYRPDITYESLPCDLENSRQFLHD